MNRIAAALFVLLLASSAAFAAELRGGWTATAGETGKLHLNLVRDHHQNGHGWQIADLAGLAEAQVRAATQTPVAFNVRREAGTIAFEGTFKDGYGGGQFTFTPNRGYIDTVRQLGATAEEDSDDVDEQLLAFAINDVSTTFIRSMQAAGYRVSLEKYLAMRIFRVTPELVQELRALGYGSLEADDLIASQIHGATPEFIRTMASLGYKDLSHDDLLSFRIHGVTPDFIRELRGLGYDKIDAEDLVAMRIHGVSPQFIRELREAGYQGIPVEKLVEMRIHGIDAKYVRRMNRE